MELEPCRPTETVPFDTGHGAVAFRACGKPGGSRFGGIPGREVSGWIGEFTTVAEGG